MNSKRLSRAGLAVAGALAVGALTACSTPTGTPGSGAEAPTKHIVLALSFPCGLNGYATLLCAGAEEAGSDLPDGYSFEIKNGVDFADNTAYNNLIQTTLQTKPSGLIVFPSGPAAQTPILNAACDQQVKVLIIDSPADGVKCEAGFIGADHYELGVLAGQYLIDNPPATSQIGIITQPPGQYVSTDTRLKGFTETVEAAGYEIAATVTSDASLDKTRTQVTNMVTAHPDISAVFSTTGIFGGGVSQALAGKSEITQVTLDGFLPDVELVASGVVAANAAQNPYEMGQLAVRSMVDVIAGESIPKEQFTSALLLTQENAQEYIDNEGKF